MRRAATRQTNCLTRHSPIRMQTRNVAAVVMTRPLPGLKSAEDPFVLPECNEEEFLFIASKIAGRKVNRVEIPFREYQSRLPLFATMVGAYLRQPMPMQERTPSQIVSEMVRRVLDDSLDNLGDTEEFLKKLAVASITSGESVEKALVASKASDQARIVDSRIVVEDGGKFGLYARNLQRVVRSKGPGREVSLT